MITLLSHFSNERAQIQLHQTKQYFHNCFLPFWSPSLLGVPVSLCSNDSTEVLLSLLILPFAPLPELRPCPFLSPILPIEPWGPLGVWLPLSDLGSQGEGWDWLPAPPCFPWLGSLESICAALEGDITGGDLTMASCLDFGLLRNRKQRDKVKTYVKFEATVKRKSWWDHSFILLSVKHIL